LGARGLRSYSYSGRWEQGAVMRGGCGSSTSTALRAEYEYEYEYGRGEARGDREGAEHRQTIAHGVSRGVGFTNWTSPGWGERSWVDSVAPSGGVTGVRSVHLTDQGRVRVRNGSAARLARVPWCWGRGRYRRRGDVPVFFYRCGSNLVLAIRGSGPQAWEMLLMDPPSCGGTRVGAGSRPSAPA
jgi:hypothetical protein